MADDSSRGQFPLWTSTPILCTLAALPAFVKPARQKRGAGLCNRPYGSFACVGTDRDRQRRSLECVRSALLCVRRRASPPGGYRRSVAPLQSRAAHGPQSPRRCRAAGCNETTRGPTHCTRRRGTAVISRPADRPPADGSIIAGLAAPKGVSFAVQVERKWDNVLHRPPGRGPSTLSCPGSFRETGGQQWQGSTHG